MQYRRVLLKLSGELLGSADETVDLVWINRVVQEIVLAVSSGVQIAIVVGGGNLFRGASLANQGVNRITADLIGRVGTAINALVLEDVLEQHGVEVDVYTATEVEGIPLFNAKQAVRSLESGRVVVFSGGTGNPLVTTDSAASLRAIEIDAEILLKATGVDGVYSDDPKKNTAAKRYKQVGFSEVIEKELKVMDIGAFMQCHKFGVPICVFDINKPEALLRVLRGEQEGTVISEE